MPKKKTDDSTIVTSTPPKEPKTTSARSPKTQASAAKGAEKAAKTAKPIKASAEAASGNESELLMDDSYGDLLKTILPEDADREAVARMRTNIKARRSCSGYIYAVEYKNGLVYIAVRDSEKLRVLIPASEFFLPNTFTNMEKISTHEKLRRYQQYAARMIGGVITYIPMACAQDDDGHWFVVASRLKSAMAKRRKYFFGPDGPLVKEGSVVRASILSSNDDSIRVEVFGVEARVPRTELSGREVPQNVAETYRVGSGFVCKVMSVEMDQRTRDVKLRLSGAQLERESGEGGNVSSVTLGGRYMATVLRVLQNSYLLVLDGLNIRAFVRKENYLGASVLMQNDKVVFRCHTIDAENNVLRGGCVKT